MERTLVLVKPDGVQRARVGTIIARLEEKGLRLVGLKLMQLTRAQAEAHYSPHRERSFFPGLIEFITSGPIVAMAWEGREAIQVVRAVMGATDPVKAQPGTIRGDYALAIGQNLVHGSDSAESAERELAIFFKPEELLTYRRAVDLWIHEA